MRSTVASKYPYLDALGGHSSWTVVERLLRQYLPGRELHRERPRPGLGHGWELFELHLRPGWGRAFKRSAGPYGGAKVLANKIVAATVILIIEEYLRWRHEPPEELLACASLCWMDELAMSPPGERLRGRGHP